MANGHGGERSNAGAKPGGVSQLRRLLCGALADGLEMAGRSSGIEGDSFVVARETAARIVSDMILAGRGEDVLKLMAASATKGADGGGEGDSPVMQALRKLPGMLEARPVSTLQGEVTQTDQESAGYAQRATDITSGEGAGQVETVHQVEPRRSYFAPQIPLLPAELAPSIDRASRPSTARPGAPHPPAPGAPATPYPRTPPLENSGAVA